MKTQFTPVLVELTITAALHSFWRKNALARFLQVSGVAECLPWLPGESKREYLHRVFEALCRSEQGKAKIVRLARHLAEQTAFPDLSGWEDTNSKLQTAKAAVAELKDYLRLQDISLANDENRILSRDRLQQAQAESRASLASLDSLNLKLSQLISKLGTQEAGLEFEKWFYDLMQFSEIVARPPYQANGRQIDGSITIGDTTYLIECKFTRETSGGPDIDVFRSKVESKADNTMGLFISMAGYSSVAVKEASGKKTPLLLLDSQHLYLVLTGSAKFRDVIERVRRHSSQTGEAYLPAKEFGG